MIITIIDFQEKQKQIEKKFYETKIFFIRIKIFLQIHVFYNDILHYIMIWLQYDDDM